MAYFLQLLMGFTLHTYPCPQFRYWPDKPLSSQLRKGYGRPPPALLSFTLVQARIIKLFHSLHSPPIKQKQQQHSKLTPSYSPHLCRPFGPRHSSRTVMFNRNFLFFTYNHIIRMNSKVQHFNDSIQMLRPPIDPCLTAPPSPSKIPEKQTTLSPNQKSLERYQKSNICPSESQSMCGQGRLGLNWSIQQQNTLVALHNSRGNKWVQIAHLLGKSDNEVKNRYHSKLRKGIRKINKLITDSRLPLKNVKSNIISKIIQTAEDRYLPLPNTPAPHATEAYQLKNAILDIAGLPEEGLSDLEREMMRRTIDRITSFNKSYRKKCKVAPVRPVVSCKYKGKEIKTLLKENEQTAFKNKVRERERQAKELEEPSINEDFHSDLQEQFPVNSSGQFQTYFVFSQLCMSFPSFYLACLPTGHLEPCDRFSSVQFEGSQPFLGAQMCLQADSISF